MRKIIVFLSLLYLSGVCAFSVYAFCSIDINGYVLKNISEISNAYYYAKNDIYHASLTVGTREENYNINGESNPMVPFLVFLINFSNKYDEIVSENITVELKIGNKKIKEKLKLCPINSSYMTEFRQEIKNVQKIEFNVKVLEDNYYGELEKISDNWKISSEQALIIGMNYYENELKNWVKNFSFKGECFVRILTNYSEKEKQIFWQISFVSANNQDLLAIIDNSSGEVIYSRILNA